jgi:Flp pilus assembly protein TadG
LSLSNVGDGAVRSIIVKLSSDTVTITSGEETFAGTLNVDETNTVVATVRASSSSKSEDNAITVTITFKDSNNQEHTVKKTIYLHTSSTGSTSTTTSGLTGKNSSQQSLLSLLPVGIGAVILAIALYFGYKWWSGKKSIKK